MLAQPNPKSLAALLRPILQEVRLRAASPANGSLRYTRRPAAAAAREPPPSGLRRAVRLPSPAGPRAREAARHPGGREDVGRVAPHAGPSAHSHAHCVSHFPEEAARGGASTPLNLFSLVAFPPAQRDQGGAQQVPPAEQHRHGHAPRHRLHGHLQQPRAPQAGAPEPPRPGAPPPPSPPRTPSAPFHLDGGPPPPAVSSATNSHNFEPSAAHHTPCALRRSTKTSRW